MADNLVRLDLSRFSARDARKIDELGDKMRLLHRWFRCERASEPGGEAFAVYSGDRGPRAIRATASSATRTAPTACSRAMAASAWPLAGRSTM